jgi:hypothetical protein
MQTVIPPFEKAALTATMLGHALSMDLAITAVQQFEQRLAEIEAKVADMNEEQHAGFHSLQMDHDQMLAEIFAQADTTWVN